MRPRLASGVLARALMQRAEAEGGFGTVIQKGDANSGALLLILLEKGQGPGLFEKILQPDGSYGWQESPFQAVGNMMELEEFLQRKKKFDPDLWILELDVPDRQRFIDGLGTFH